MLSLGLGVRHPRPDAAADHRKLLLRKDPSNLQKSLGHRIRLTSPAVHGDAPHDDKPQMLVPNHVNDLAELLR